MLRQLASLLIAAAAIPAAYSQYYGTAVYSEGFDADEFPSAWTQENLAEGDDTRFSLSSGEVASFSSIVPTNRHSALFKVPSKNVKLTLTSPEIDATGKTNLQAGFYGYELKYAVGDDDVDFRFRASHDGGLTWTDLFAPKQNAKDSYNGYATVGKWNVYKFTLPPEFDGQKILLQFYIDASNAWSAPRGLNGYLDEVFVSTLPEVDPMAVSLNYSSDSRRPSSEIYGETEKVMLTVRNAGTRALESLEVYYKVDNGAEVVETINFPTPLELGQEYNYTFTAAADLSSSLLTHVVTAGVRALADSDLSNNEVTAYAKNLAVSVPYVPFAHEDEYGDIEYSNDDWTSFEVSDCYGWDYDDWDDFYWYVEPEWEDDDLDCWLVSRPLQLKGGNEYRLQFSVYSDDDYGCANAMSVYLASDDYMEEDRRQIWTNGNIDEDNALGQSVVFSVPEGGIWYLGFQASSEAGAAMMVLRDIAVYKNVDKDMAVSNLQSPLADQYTYTNTEKVRASVSNYGALPLAAGDARLVVSLDGTEVLSEALPAMASNTSIDYVSGGVVDLSKLGHNYAMEVKVVLDGDEDLANNSLSRNIESSVAAVPYVADFGTQTGKGRDLNYWLADDRDADGYTFTAAYDGALGSYAYSYGGGLYGLSTVTLPSGNDALLSRHFQLAGGKKYKLVFSDRIGKNEASMPLAVTLRKVSDGSEVAKILETAVTNTVYKENVCTFEVADDGIYQIEFAVVNDQPVDFRLSVGGVRLNELQQTDLSLEEIVLPTARISHVRTFPVGAVIRNNGTEPVTAFTLTATSKSLGTKTAEFKEGITVEPDQSYLVYFGENFTFDGDDDEQLSVAVSCQADGCADNDALKQTISYFEALELPYNPMPNEAMEHTGAYNLNRDNFRFVPDRSLGTGHLFAADPESDIEHSDYVATPGLKLSKDLTMRVSFTYYVLDGDCSDMNIYAFDLANDVVVPITAVRNVSQNSMTRFTGYFDVPSDGVYSIAVQPGAKSPSLFVSAPITVEEVAGRPDLVMGSLESHLEGAVLTENETVKVNFTSVSDFGLESVPFELTVGDDTYTALFTRHTTKNDNDNYSVTFENVNLSDPGTYTLTCKAVVNLDATPENNVAEFEVVSLPVVDVAVKSLVSPQSGILSDAESVAVELENLGKGAVSDVTVNCTVTLPDGTASQLTATTSEAIAEGATATVTFPATVDMFAEGVYKFDITAVAAGDVDEDNNTLTVSVNSTSKPFDAGVLAIVSPVDAALDSGVTVTIEVKNFGETDIFSVPVSVTVTGVDADNVQKLEGTVPEIKAGESVEYTFPGSVDMDACGDYTLVATTAVAGDVDTDNDSATATVRCQTRDVGVTAILSPTDGFRLDVYDVTVEVTNFGEATVSGIPMMYQIGNIPQLDVMDDEVAPGETVSYTFSTPYEFTELKTRQIKAATQLEKDVNKANDALELTIEPNSSVGNITLTLGVTPNPTNGPVKVTAEEAIDNVELYDMSGRRVAAFDGDGTNVLAFNLLLPKGSYVVKVYTAESVATTLLIVK